jgi:hypothetical protein
LIGERTGSTNDEIGVNRALEWCRENISDAVGRTGNVTNRLTIRARPEE